MHTIPRLSNDPTLLQEERRLTELNDEHCRAMAALPTIRGELETVAGEHRAAVIEAVRSNRRPAIDIEAPLIAARAALAAAETRSTTLAAAIVQQRARVDQVRQRRRLELLPTVQALRAEIASEMLAHVDKIESLNRQLVGMINEWGSSAAGYSLPIEFALVRRVLGAR